MWIVRNGHDQDYVRTNKFNLIQKQNVRRPLTKKTSVSRKRSDVLKVEANAYEYCDSNVSFIVHDVVKRDGCETFVIDFDGVSSKPVKKPPMLTRPKSSVQSSPSASSTPSSSPSAIVKSKTVPNPKKLPPLGSRKNEKDLSNKAIKTKASGLVKPKVPSANTNHVNNNYANSNNNYNKNKQILKKVQTKNIRNEGNGF